MAEILAALTVVTVLVVLLLAAVITERVTRAVTVLRHTHKRYAVPRTQLEEQTRRIAAWRDARGG